MSISPFKMTSGRKSFTVATLLIIMMKVFSGLTLSCLPTEYQIAARCCLMCPAGFRVDTDCVEGIKTSCLPCQEGTYMDKANGLKNCVACTNCHSGSGLKVKTACSTTSDTVCEPLEGFYCIDSTGASCAAAHKYRSCEPGQYINQKGTASTDTECSDCSSGTFSDGTLTSCQPHTQCESLNLQLITAGNASTDALCGGQSENSTLPLKIAIGCVSVILIIIFIVGLLYYLKIKKRHATTGNTKNKEENEGRTETAPMMDQEHQHNNEPRTAT